MDQLLSSAEAAKLLGVGPTTVKRWADEGVLPCAKTAGRHRRFRRVDVERYAAQGQPAPAPGAPQEGWASLLVSPANVHAVHAALLSERAASGSWWQVGDRVGGVLVEVGEAWRSGRMTVADEHRASEKLARALARCAEALPQSHASPQCLLAVAEGDGHDLGLRLTELALLEAGWNTVWLGAPTPTRELLKHIARAPPAMVGVSASTASRPDALKRQARQLVETCRDAGARLLLGGTGPWPEIEGARRMPTLRQLAALLRSGPP